MLAETTPIDDGATRWRAVAAADPRADGRFVYAVRTTGIYCRPTCPAPRPKRDNVRFFDAPVLAEAAGFRACKRCRPAPPNLAAGEAVRETPGAVLFVDLVGASPRMRRATPSEAALDALRFFAEVEAVVKAHGGVVHKFLGDGALIWFERTAGARDNEARAALACTVALRNRDARAGSGRLRLGLHYGQVGLAKVAGRVELLGHTVNAAKRLEAATRRLDVALLVSDDGVRASGLDGEAAGLRRLARPLRLRGCSTVTSWAG